MVVVFVFVCVCVRCVRAVWVRCVCVCGVCVFVRASVCVCVCSLTSHPQPDGVRGDSLVAGDGVDAHAAVDALVGPPHLRDLQVPRGQHVKPV